MCEIFQRLHPATMRPSVREALARSPELAAAKLRVTQSEKAIALAQTSYYPDLTVSAGFMYRGTDDAAHVATQRGVDRSPVFWIEAESKCCRK